MYTMQEQDQKLLHNGCISLETGGEKNKFRTEAILFLEEGELSRDASGIKLKRGCFAADELMKTENLWMTAYHYQQVSPWIEKAIANGKYRFIDIFDVLSSNGYTSLVSGGGKY